MRELVPADYTDFPIVTAAEVPVAHESLLADETPGFVVRTHAVSLADALERNGVDELFNRAGFCSAGEVNDPFHFHHTSALLEDLTGIVPPATYGDWERVGVTSLHFDFDPREEHLIYAANFTVRGIAELRAHPIAPCLTRDQQERYSEFNSRTTDLWWHDKVDPEVMTPQGYRVRLAAGDLAVFNGRLVHSVRTLKAPRSAQVAVYPR